MASSKPQKSPQSHGVDHCATGFASWVLLNSNCPGAYETAAPFRPRLDGAELMTGSFAAARASPRIIVFDRGHGCPSSARLAAGGNFAAASAIFCSSLSA